MTVLICARCTAGDHQHQTFNDGSIAECPWQAVPGNIDAECGCAWRGMPQRIQRKRTKGWRMPAGAIYVGRPTEWGNPWKVGDHVLVQWPYAAHEQHARELLITARLAVELYRIAFTPDVDEIRTELAGRDLACWCSLDQPCHVDVLLELANGGA